MSEQWKPIKGLSGYQISNLGNLRDNKLNAIEWRYNKSDGDYLKRNGLTLRKSTAMRENWKYEWIKDLKDDEEATPIKGYPDYYITNKGRVYSLKTYRWLSITKEPNYYYYFARIGGRNIRVHILVGKHFLKDYREGDYILHRNENLGPELINCVENLWSGTHKDNMRDMAQKGRVKGRGVELLTEDQVREVRRALDRGDMSLTIAQQMGMTVSQVGGIRRGETYKWVT